VAASPHPNGAKSSAWRGDKGIQPGEGGMMIDRSKDDQKQSILRHRLISGPLLSALKVLAQLGIMSAGD
jgi:hypothetical protein